MIDNTQVNAYDLYNQDNGYHRLLSIDEEQSYIARIRSGDPDALNEFVSCNQRLVSGEAWRYWNSAISGIQMQKLEWLDLVQAGNMGLLHALRKYEPFRGLKFSTYAVRWIRQYIRRYCVINSHVFSVSYRDGDILAVKGTQSSTFRRAPVIYLDAPIQEGTTLYSEILASSDGVEEAASNRADFAIVMKQIERIKKIDPRSHLALALRFGLDGNPEHTYDQIARRIGVSNVTAAVIIKQALLKIRIYMSKGIDYGRKREDPKTLY